MPGSISNYAEAIQLDHMYGATQRTGGTPGSGNFEPPTVLHVALMIARGTDAQSDAGTNFTEVSGPVGTSGYERKAITQNFTNWRQVVGQAADTPKKNLAEFAYNVALTAWGTIKHWAIFDAASAGNLYDWGDLCGAIKNFIMPDAGTDVITSLAHGYAEATLVWVGAHVNVALPTGLSELTDYYARDVTTDTFKLYTVPTGGSPVALTAFGMGRVWEMKPKIIGIGDQFKFPTDSIQLTRT